MITYKDFIKKQEELDLKIREFYSEKNYAEYGSVETTYEIKNIKYNGDIITVNLIDYWRGGPDFDYFEIPASKIDNLDDYLQELIAKKEEGQRIQL